MLLQVTNGGSIPPTQEPPEYPEFELPVGKIQILVAVGGHTEVVADGAVVEVALGVQIPAVVDGPF